jgi:hypothetical protein
MYACTRSTAAGPGSTGATCSTTGSGSGFSAFLRPNEISFFQIEVGSP